MLVLQITPKPKVMYTGLDKDIPEVIGVAIAQIAIQIGNAAKHDPIEVLQAMQVLILGTASRIIEQDKLKNRTAQDMVKQMTGNKNIKD